MLACLLWPGHVDTGLQFPLITDHIWGLALSIACAVLMILCSRFTCYNKNLAPDWLLSGWRWPVIGSARSSHFQHLSHTGHMCRWSLGRLLHILFNMPALLCSLGKIYDSYNYVLGWTSALLKLTAAVQCSGWTQPYVARVGHAPSCDLARSGCVCNRDLYNPGLLDYGPSYFDGQQPHLPPLPLQLFGVTVTTTESASDTVTNRILKGVWWSVSKSVGGAHMFQVVPEVDPLNPSPSC